MLKSELYSYQITPTTVVLDLTALGHSVYLTSTVTSGSLLTDKSLFYDCYKAIINQPIAVRLLDWLIISF